MACQQTFPLHTTAAETVEAEKAKRPAPSTMPINALFIFVSQVFLGLRDKRQSLNRVPARGRRKPILICIGTAATLSGPQSTKRARGPIRRDVHKRTIVVATTSAPTVLQHNRDTRLQLHLKAEGGSELLCAPLPFVVLLWQRFSHSRYARGTSRDLVWAWGSE